MKKILIIEDEPSVLENIMELLEGHDYQVFGAENGKIGITKAREHIPDLIICDIMMPELDGYGVLKSLQSDSITSTIPFIFLTAKSELSDLRQGMELGADDYLTKPFLPDELFKTVETRLVKADKVSTKTEKLLRELTLNIASTLPHELRTPLNGILASSQILIDYYDTMNKTEIKQLHENIYSSSKRLYDLIARYLSYSNIELLFFDDKHRKELLENCEHVEVDVIIEKSAKKIANEFGRIDDLELNIAPGSYIINLDHIQLVAEELCSNAFKFSEKGSKVEVISTVDEKHLSLTVKDQGRGMTSEQINKIGAYIQFERNLYEQQGSGLGLISVKRLTQIYGGELVIDSKQYQHTDITFKI